MADADEEISEMILKSLMREIGKAGVGATAAILKGLFDAAQGFGDKVPADIEPRVEVEMTRGDFEAAAAKAVAEGIDLRAERWDPDGGSDCPMTASIPVSQIDRFTDFWERAIESKLVGGPALPSKQPEGPEVDVETALDEVAHAMEDAGGKFDYSIGENGMVVMTASPAAGASAVETVVKAAANAGVELDGVGEFSIPEADFGRIKLYADGLGVAIAVSGTDRFGNAVEPEQGMVAAKVRCADAEGFKMALAQAAEREEEKDPEFAQRCREMVAGADRSFDEGRVYASPTATVELGRKEFEAFAKVADEQGIPYAARGDDNVSVDIAARDAERAATAVANGAPGASSTAEKLRDLKDEARRKASTLMHRARQATEHSRDAERKDAPDRNRSQGRER